MFHRNKLAKRQSKSDSGKKKSVALEEFHYQISWRSHSAIPGQHLSTHAGGGYEFQGHAPLISNPDARNLDVHASLHDPFGQFFIRTFRQRSSIPVFVIADLSASMNFCGNCRKTDVIANFCSVSAYSAYRTGDSFGFLGCSEQIHWDLYLPLRWRKSISHDIIVRLNNFHPRGNSIQGLFDAASVVGKRRGLIFLLSDFHIPTDQLCELLEAFAAHDLIPIVIWDSFELEPPGTGFYRLRDPESGQERSIFMRPQLQQAFIDTYIQRRHELIRQFDEYGRKPFFVVDQFDPEAMSQYFYDGYEV